MFFFQPAVKFPATWRAVSAALWLVTKIVAKMIIMRRRMKMIIMLILRGLVVMSILSVSGALLQPFDICLLADAFDNFGEEHNCF